MVPRAPVTLLRGPSYHTFTGGVVRGERRKDCLTFYGVLDVTSAVLQPSSSITAVVSGLGTSCNARISC